MRDFYLKGIYDITCFKKVSHKVNVNNTKQNYMLNFINYRSMLHSVQKVVLPNFNSADLALYPLDTNVAIQLLVVEVQLASQQI